MRRAGWAGVALLLVLAATIAPLARALSPRLAVRLATGFGQDPALEEFTRRARLALHEHAVRPLLVAPGERSGGAVHPSGLDLLDPWGRPWRVRMAETSWVGSSSLRTTWIAGGEPYSVGPDGVDDLAEGDDVVARAPSDASPSLLPVALRRWPRAALAGFALMLALHLGVGPRPRSESRAREVLLAGLLALPWSVLFTLWVPSLEKALARGGLLRDAGALQVPKTVAASGTVAVLAFGLALAWRLTRPAAAGEGAPLDRADGGEHGER